MREALQVPSQKGKKKNTKKNTTNGNNNDKSDMSKSTSLEFEKIATSQKREIPFRKIADRDLQATFLSPRCDPPFPSITLRVFLTL